MSERNLDDSWQRFVERNERWITWWSDEQQHRRHETVRHSVFRSTCEWRSNSHLNNSFLQVLTEQLLSVTSGRSSWPKYSRWSRPRAAYMYLTRTGISLDRRTLEMISGRAKCTDMRNLRKRVTTIRKCIPLMTSMMHQASRIWRCSEHASSLAKTISYRCLQVDWMFSRMSSRQMTHSSFQQLAYLSVKSTSLENWSKLTFFSFTSHSGRITPLKKALGLNNAFLNA